MCDSEDDLSSMSTVPYEYDASDCSDSIYEKETQAIGELENVEGNKGKSQKDNIYNSEIETVLYSGPTQPMKLKDSGLRSNSSTTTVGQSTSSETKQIVDSDCETIPESPVIIKDDEIDFQKLNSRPASSASSLTDDDRTQLLPLVHQVNTFSSTTQPNCISPEIPLYEGPTQRLLIKSHITPNSSQEDVAYASKAGQSIDISDFDTLPMSPNYYPEVPSPAGRRGSPEGEYTRSETPMYDGPTQPLPVRHNTKLTECTRSETPMYDGPTQPLPVRHNTKLTECTRSETPMYDGPTQPLPVRHNTELTESTRSITPIYDGPTQPLPVRSKTKPNSAPKETSLTESIQDVPSPVRRTSASSDMEIEEDDSDQTQVIPDLIHSFERGPSSAATVITDAENDELSDCETLPSSPVHHLNSTLEIPSTQSTEDKRQLRGGDVWGALKKVDNWDSETADSCPLSPDLFDVSSPCHELDTVQNSTIESEKDKNDDQNPSNSRRDPTTEMGRATIPESPVFDFYDSHNEQADDETQVLSPPVFRDQGSPAFVAETPFVPHTTSGRVSEEMPIVAETPFVVDDFESPLVSDETPRKKRKIVRRSGHACRQLLPEKNLSIDHRTSTPQDMDLESTKGDEAMPIDDAASVESDFELTFASHYSPLPTLAASASSTEPPFVGFEAIEVEVPTTHLEQIRQVIDNDQMESVEEGNAAEKVSAQLPPPTAPVEITAIAGPSTAKIPTPRRSSRRPVPNTRRTFDISEPNLEPVAIKRRPGRPSKATNKIEIQSSNESDASEPVTAIKRRPGRQAKGIKVKVKSSEGNVSEPVVTAITRKPGRQAKGLKVEVKSSDEDVSEPVVIAITRRPGRQAKGLKVEVKSSDEDVSEPVVTAITRRLGRQAKGLKVEVKSSDEDVSEPVVTAAVKRRPGRPLKIEASIPKKPSETMKPVIPKASTSVLSSDAAESSEENRAANLRTSRKTRVGRKEKDAASVSVVEPPTSPLLAKRKPQNQVKKELADGSLLESALNKTTVAAQRRSRRSVNNNRDDLSVTSSVGSNSPSIQEATRRRKRALAGQVRVLFTVINDDGEHSKIVESLGGRVVTTFKDCSVLVTDRVRRTLKFLCCVGLGTPIVGVEWLTTCRTSRKFVDPWLHLLIDKAGEEKFDFKLSASLEVAKETPLLSGWIFHATPSVLPKPVEMQEIVESCGGIYFEESDNSVDDNKIVISCESDKQLWPKWKKRCATLVDKEAILSGVLQQVFEPDKFKLDV